MSNLSTRMKAYEKEETLIPRTPFIVRLDGNSFHKVTKGLDKPFDREFMLLMRYLMSTLANESDDCVLGYTQSDEITLAFMPYKRYDTIPFLKGRVQKITSLLAAKATALTYEYLKDKPELASKLKGLVYFDARVFNLPSIEEILNAVTWRVLDAERCSTNLYGQSFYKPKEIEGVKLKALREKMLQEKEFRWEDIADEYKRGWLWDYSKREAKPCPRDWKEQSRELLESYVLEK